MLTDSATEFDVVKETVYGVETGKLDKSEEVRVLKEMFGTGYILSYKSGNGTAYGWEDRRRKGKSRRTVIRNYINKQQRGRNDKQSKETEINHIDAQKADSNEPAFSNAENTKRNSRHTPGSHSKTALPTVPKISVADLLDIVKEYQSEILSKYAFNHYGLVSVNKVTLNIHSTKSLNAVVGHEIVHILEGTEHYAALQEMVKQYAQTKGEYDTRLQSIA